MNVLGLEMLANVNVSKDNMDTYQNVQFIRVKHQLYAQDSVVGFKTWPLRILTGSLGERR